MAERTVANSPPPGREFNRTTLVSYVLGLKLDTSVEESVFVFEL
jgi:hypothetical protein